MENFKELDIDTSDLQSFIQRCNSKTPLIRGPVGNVQAVLLNRSSNDGMTTQQFLKELGDETHRRDFGTNAWEWAEKLIVFHGNFSTVNSKSRSVPHFSSFCSQGWWMGRPKRKLRHWQKGKCQWNCHYSLALSKPVNQTG